MCGLIIIINCALSSHIPKEIELVLLGSLNLLEKSVEKEKEEYLRATQEEVPCHLSCGPTSLSIFRYWNTQVRHWGNKQT